MELDASDVIILRLTHKKLEMENSCPISQIVVNGQVDKWFCSPKHYKCNSKEFILAISMFFSAII